MTETSRGRVTITLGGSGQVVKRSGDGFSDSHVAVGTKRSVRDRLGSNVDNSLLHGNEDFNKRQRGNSDVSSLNAKYAIGVKDLPIGKNDLRYKIMQKNLFTRSQSDEEGKAVDLREKLSRVARHQSSTVDIHQRMPEPMCTSIFSQAPPTRNSNGLPQMDSMRHSSSPWTLDHIRRKSPDGRQSSSRSLSQQSTVEDLPKRPLTYNDIKAFSYMKQGILDPKRPVAAVPIMTNTIPGGPVKPAISLSAQTPSGGVVRKSSYMADEQPTIDGLLHSLGLGKYAISFKAEEVDMTALKQMGENDLKELGIPMGPRKKILLAIRPRTKQQQPS